MDVKLIGGLKCYICHHVIDCDTSIIYWGVNKDSKELVSDINSYLSENRKEDSYILIAFEVPNWNYYLSPWKASINDGNQEFSGYGQDTLNWINKNIPEIERVTLDSLLETPLNYQKCRRYIMGYSLSGLFALWAFYECQLFEGVASCSGSLWYPEWKEYVLNKQISRNSSIYLSLGKKEEKTSNAVMKQVGDITRWQYDMIIKDNNVINSKMVWHNGGHFHNIEKRILDAIEWILDIV